jgi:hypothetical protein
MVSTFHPGASRKERERSNEQERIANDCFTSMVVGGCVDFTTGALDDTENDGNRSRSKASRDV